MNKKEEVIKEEICDETKCESNIDKDEYIAKLNSDLVDQRKKSDEYFEHLKRNMAEFDNFKKRMNKEKENLYNTVTSDIVESILPILDNFEQAMGVECSDENFKNGIAMIYNQLKDTMLKQGLDEIIALGQTFNPHLHEAVMHIEDENYGEKEVVEVFRKGYMLGDKVIRHSMVKVCN